MRNPRPNTTGLQPYKPTWNSGQTRTIRVPISLADEILDYARQLDIAPDTKAKKDYKLDGGKVPLASSIASLDKLSDRITEILAKVEAKETGYKPNGATRLIKDLKSLFD
jgi:hypothetical protein